MSIRIKGNVAELTAYADRLETLHTVLPKAAKETAARGAAELKKNFASKRDPYGSGWAARKRAAAWPLMQKSKALLGSLRGWASGRMFKLGFGTGYGIFHQSGTSRMVQRMVIPDQGKGIPPKWLPWMTKILDDLMAEHLGG